MKKNPKNKLGYALLTVLGIMSVLAITFTMLLKASQQGAFTGKLLVDRTKATAYAEAGIEFAYAFLRDDFETRSNPSAFWISTNQAYSAGTPIDYHEGSFTLTLTTLSGGQYVVINSVGNCGNSSAEVEALIEDTTFGNADAWQMAAFGGGIGTSRVGGGGFLDSDGNRQTVHCNGPINCNGGASIDANVNSGGTISGAGNVQGTPLNNQPHISPPTLESRYESFSTYKSIADNVITGGYTLKKNNSAGWDILYVDGDVVIKGDFTGTIICTGNFTVQAGGSINKGSSGIAVATQTGSIQYNTGSNCSGLFYAQTGDFSQKGSGSNLDGQIIVGGVFDKTGGSGITFEGDGATETDANPVIAGWQK